MRGTRMLGAAFGALLALTAGGIAVGFSSHPVGTRSHPSIRQPLNAVAHDVQFTYADVSGTNRRYSAYVYFGESVIAEASAGAKVGSTIDQRARVTPSRTSRYAEVQICELPRTPRSCRYASSRNANSTIRIERSPIRGEIHISGKVRDLSFDVWMQRDGLPRTGGNDFTWYTTDPQGRQKLWLFAHRTTEVWTTYEATGMLVEGQRLAPRWNHGADGRYVHYDVHTFG